jgi:hypothetical protein
VPARHNIKSVGLPHMELSSRLNRCLDKLIILSVWRTALFICKY